MKKKSFLGTGWSFPPEFDPKTGNVKLVSDEDDIKQSLFIYFNTRIGERMMRPKYGCVIHEKQFDKLSSNIVKVLMFEMTNEIGNIEPRIKVQDIFIQKLDANKGYFEIKLDYTVITSNVKDNIVFPYYYSENL